MYCGLLSPIHSLDYLGQPRPWHGKLGLEILNVPVVLSSFQGSTAASNRSFIQTFGLGARSNLGDCRVEINREVVQVKQGLKYNEEKKY